MKTENNKPILMRPELVEATFALRKTETRRTIKNKSLPLPEICHYGKKGDRLWVREPVQLRAIGKGWFDVNYKSGHCPVHFGGIPHPVLKNTSWTPSIHMPRQVFRLELLIKRVTPVYVQDITSAQAVAEGYEYITGLRWGGKKRPNEPTPREWFRLLWDKINEAKGLGWDYNPIVWRIEYEISTCRTQ